MDTFRRVVDSLEGLPNLNRVIFTGFGEPLSHPNILEMIEAMRKRDLAVSVGSNGLLLKPEDGSRAGQVGCGSPGRVR